jgi:hypothetical protein
MNKFLQESLGLISADRAFHFPGPTGLAADTLIWVTVQLM